MLMIRHINLLADLIRGCRRWHCSTGCETLHSSVRSRRRWAIAAIKKEDDPAEPKAVEVGRVEGQQRRLDRREARSYFSANSGARSGFSRFSPEAQQIEKDLGVY